MKKEKIKKLISQIKGKKNIGVNDDYVFDLLSNFLKQNKFKELFEKDLKFIFRNKEFRKITKEIREELHRVYGVYQVKKQWKKEELLKNLKNKDFEEIKYISREILKLHSSSRERLKDYEDVYEKIFNITGKPEIIIDLASGLNPCSLILINFKGKCFAYDVSESDVNFLNEYFKIIKKYSLDGKAIVKDIRKDFNFENGDIYFLFKFLDLINDKKNFFIKLISNLKCKYLVISFPKKTISLKNMKNVKRKWFIKLLEKNNLYYSLIDSQNELFYIIKLE